LAATEGCFDPVPLNKVKAAQSAILSQLHKEHRKDMDIVNKGDKPDEKIQKTIVAIANGIAATYKEEKKPETEETPKE
jgi:hypothetical protein